MSWLLGKQPKAPKPQAPPWLKWVLLAFIAYSLAMSQHQGSHSSEAFKKTSHEITSENFHLSDYKNRLFPASSASLRTKDDEVGTGQPAICGQEVKIAYQAFLTEDKTIDDSAGPTNPLAFRLGDGTVLPAFEQGVMGMRKGGKRSLIAPSDLAYDSKGHSRNDVPPNATVKLDVELLAISPALPDIETAPFKIANIANGGGDSFACGSKVKVDVTVWDVEGKKLFSTKDKGNSPLSFTIGKSEVFLGLEQGVIGMAPGGARTLIVPPSFQKTMNGNAPEIKIPALHQTVLVDVEALQ